MTITTSDVIRVSAKMKRGAIDDVVNVFYLKPVSIGAETQQALRDDIAKWVDDIYTHFLSIISDTITMDTIELFNITANVPEPAVPWPILTVSFEQIADYIEENL